MVTRIVLFLIILIVGISVAVFLNTKDYGPNELKVYQPKDVNPELKDNTINYNEKNHRIGQFAFLDQEGDTITKKDVEGKIYVADYFFTTCPTICPKMTAQLERVQEKYKDDPEILILSHTVHPENDTVEVMARYAQRHGAIPKKWYFLTGEKEELYRLARQSYFVLKPAEVGEPGDAGSDFIHTNNFVLIDQKGRIRGYYDGTSPTEVDKLMEDIQKLK
ncbi:MAG: SCO family protein [Crocinitomicaceae bacterium]|nr:SCO family protein [Crocinitomicaceae bacterium]